MSYLATLQGPRKVFIASLIYLSFFNTYFFKTFYQLISSLTTPEPTPFLSHYSKKYLVLTPRTIWLHIAFEIFYKK